MSTPSVQTLRAALAKAEQIEALKAQLATILGQVPSAPKSITATLVAASAKAGSVGTRKKPKFSKAARAAISAAQKERWAKARAVKGKESKVEAQKAPEKPAARKTGKMSAAGRANIVRAQKARWAKVRAKKG